MKRRTLLKMFPAFGLGFLVPKSAKAQLSEATTDEALLHQIREAVRAYLTKTVGIDKEEASLLIKTNTNLVLCGNQSSHNHREFELVLSFSWSHGPYLGVTVKSHSFDLERSAVNSINECSLRAHVYRRGIFPIAVDKWMSCGSNMSFLTLDPNKSNEEIIVSILSSVEFSPQQLSNFWKQAK